MNVVLVRNDSVVFREKELKIVQMLSDDQTVTAIGKKLNLNPRGLEGTVAAMKRKLGLHTIHGLVSYFIRNGYIE
jgi:DNA-binding CsgD family transcriptional regulator